MVKQSFVKQKNLAVHMARQINASSGFVSKVSVV
jgi:hypothetical protein